MNTEDKIEAGMAPEHPEHMVHYDDCTKTVKGDHVTWTMHRTTEKPKDVSAKWGFGGALVGASLCLLYILGCPVPFV